jgi:hypothetical protein
MWLPWASSTATLSFASAISPSTTTPTTTPRSIRRPWAPAEWRLQINIGREPGTWMPPEWAASGARLFFPVDCRINSELLLHLDNNKSNQMPAELELDWMSGRRARQVTVLEDATYITSSGEQIVSLPEQGGGWSLALPRQKGQAGTLRLWLDVDACDDDTNTIAAQKNDVILFAADRLYLSAKCWRESDWTIGRRLMIPIQQAAARAQERVDAQLSHETGDRGLDGTNPLDTVRASIQMAVLVKERDRCLQALREADQILPSSIDKRKDGGGTSGLFGAWPGSTEGLVVAPGTVCVKRKKLFGDEFHVVGRWDASPIC